MDPLNPVDAQQIVAEYARLLELDLEANRHPARVETLPYAKPVIKAAIATSTSALATSGQLTDNLREYLEEAYTLLAEYLEGELVALMTEYRRSADQLVREAPATREKTKTAAWRTLTASSALAGEVARAVTADADALRAEFRALLSSA
jgi:hypothetical protein